MVLNIKYRKMPTLLNSVSIKIRLSSEFLTATVVEKLHIILRSIIKTILNLQRVLRIITSSKVSSKASSRLMRNSKRNQAKKSLQL
jgi:DNA gyrase/topoisomerase IV subunit A